MSLDEKESGLRATLNLGHTFGHVCFVLVPLIILHFSMQRECIDFMVGASYACFFFQV